MCVPYLVFPLQSGLAELQGSSVPACGHHVGFPRDNFGSVSHSCLYMCGFVWVLNSLSSSSSACRRNAHNDLVLGFKKVGGIKEVDFVYHTACLKGS